MRLSVLASSSSGNASVISVGATHILVDAGISARRICAGLEQCGLTLSDISGVLITHEHIDHICGLGTMAKKLGGNLHLYCSRYLRDDLRLRAPMASLSYVEPGETIRIGELVVTPLAVKHDAIDPMGFIIASSSARLGYITDTGSVPIGLVSALHGLHALLVESNYDESMLEESGRPYALIERISGPWGHLSNTQAGELVQAVANENLHHIFLAHMSSECNTPEKAAKSMQHIIDTLPENCRPQLHLTHRDAVLPWVDL